jgi:hypothetical protein
MARKYLPDLRVVRRSPGATAALRRSQARKREVGICYGCHRTLVLCAERRLCMMCSEYDGPLTLNRQAAS